MVAVDEPGGLWRHIRGIVLQRCPRCCKGAVYAGFLRMRERCPECDWRFEREPGYFTGAMYASYILGFGVTLPAWFIMLISGASLGWIMGVVLGVLFITFPFMFRYSRVLWLHFDVYFNGTGAVPAEGPGVARHR